MPTQPPRFATKTQRQRSDEAAKEYDRRRLAETETRRLYGTARWQRMRQDTKAAANGLCESCRDQGRIVEGTTADHVEPHRGDPKKFWNGRRRWLCDHCHSSAKQREENAQARQGVGGSKNPAGSRL